MPGFVPLFLRHVFAIDTDYTLSDVAKIIITIGKVDHSASATRSSPVYWDKEVFDSQRKELHDTREVWPILVLMRTLPILSKITHSSLF